MCFPVNFAKFLRTPFFKEHRRWLLLNGHFHKSSGNLCKPNIETLQNKFTWKTLKFLEMLDLKTPINSSEKN